MPEGIVRLRRGPDARVAVRAGGGVVGEAAGGAHAVRARPVLAVLLSGAGRAERAGARLGPDAALLAAHAARAVRGRCAGLRAEPERGRVARRPAAPRRALEVLVAALARRGLARGGRVDERLDEARRVQVHADLAREPVAALAPGGGQPGDDLDAVAEEERRPPRIAVARRGRVGRDGEVPRAHGLEGRAALALRSPAVRAVGRDLAVADQPHRRPDHRRVERCRRQGHGLHPRRARQEQDGDVVLARGDVEVGMADRRERGDELPVRQRPGAHQRRVRLRREIPQAVRGGEDDAVAHQDAAADHLRLEQRHPDDGRVTVVGEALQDLGRRGSGDAVGRAARAGRPRQREGHDQATGLRSCRHSRRCTGAACRPRSRRRSSRS